MFLFFTQILEAKMPLLNRKRAVEDRLLAVHGLAAAKSIQAARILQITAEDSTQAEEIQNAARRAAAAIKRQLTPDGPPPAAGEA